MWLSELLNKGCVLCIAVNIRTFSDEGLWHGGLAPQTSRYDSSLTNEIADPLYWLFPVARTEMCPQT
jgi:hypothetical protein